MECESYFYSPYLIYTLRDTTAIFRYRKTERKVLGGLITWRCYLVLLACINFVNLATAISTQRAKEIGVRKVVGSSRRQVIEYFLGEALFITLLAVGLALATR